MKPSQRANYAVRIERALQHLQRCAASGDLPQLSELAAAAALSEYHFHRIFRLMTGETVGSATTRIRLGQAVHHLAGEDAVRDATAASGYATPQAFTRALKQQAGVTPGKLQDQHELRAEIRDSLARPQPGGSTMVRPLSIEIISFEPLRLLAVRNVGDYRELNTGFVHVFEQVGAQLAPECILGIYGIPHDDPRDIAPELCRFDCALDTGGLGEAIAPLQALRLASGRYARLPHFGDYDNIHAAIDTLYLWAIESDESVGEHPLFIHYLDDPEQVPVDQLRAFAYLPLIDD
jgi:AraC family transcriptional regulator